MHQLSPPAVFLPGRDLSVSRPLVAGVIERAPGGRLVVQNVVADHGHGASERAAARHVEHPVAFHERYGLPGVECDKQTSHVSVLTTSRPPAVWPPVLLPCTSTDCNPSDSRRSQ